MGFVLIVQVAVFSSILQGRSNVRKIQYEVRDTPSLLTKTSSINTLFHPLKTGQKPAGLLTKAVNPAADWELGTPGVSGLAVP